MFRKILIANRGEIACRIHRTAARMGIRTVGVYSEADRGALHTRLLDEAVLIGPPPARESYLVIERLIEAARRTGAAAVHPGYGFLAENADFAEAVAKAGLVFIGPPPAAIRAMGSKSAAKALMEKAGVLIVPGYHGADQSDAAFAKAAGAIGYPVLIKAALGGGGKGMRHIARAEDLADGLAAARRESLAAFGDATLLIEKYLDHPRHIEVQIFADGKGNILHLYERDCSLQRRHQKVVEEAPAPHFDAGARAEITRAAIAAARAVDYVGAGTVEFIAEAADPRHCYFMEMNTRLQVEHPVTEMITGLDLVEWQLRVAAGEGLPLAQADIALSGHAVEVRICAEDPARDFLPAVGRLLDFNPPQGSGIRLDAGIAQGDMVGIQYDSMLAKLIAHGPDRKTAIARLAAALSDTRLSGVVSNIDFLRGLISHPDFAEGKVETGFIARHAQDLLAAAAPEARDFMLAALAEQLALAQSLDRQSLEQADRWSPWATADGWRLGARQALTWHFTRDGDSDGAPVHAVSIQPEGEGFLLKEGENNVHATAMLDAEGFMCGEIAGHAYRAYCRVDGDWRWLQHADRRLRLRALGPFPPTEDRAAATGQGSGRIRAPMPGRVLRVMAAENAPVKTGEAVFILEAMKMEHSLVAPIDGTLASVAVRVGDLVAEGDLLALITAEGAAA